MPGVAAKMDLNLNHLTESERDAIMSVLRRDEDLRLKENDRVRKLRQEIKQIKLKGVIRPGDDPDNSCTRCREKFGWFLNRGAPCPKCQHKICQNCRRVLTGPNASGSWICVLCFKQKELDAMSGQWFYSKFRESKRNRKTKKVITGPDLVRTSIRRRGFSSGRTQDTAQHGTPADEVKNALTAKPNKSQLNAPMGSSIEEELSDTQSTEAVVTPPPGKQEQRDIMAPKATDQERLNDLMKVKGIVNAADQPNNVHVRKIKSKKYQSDSDTSSSESGPSSPHLSAQTESAFSYGESQRSSMRSSSAVSSDGHITMVTESYISDRESLQSFNTERGSPKPRRSASMRSRTSRTGNLSSDSVIENPSHSSQIMEDSLDNTPKHDSMSSDSEEEFTTEQLTKVKFRRMSTNRRSKSPDGRAPSPVATEEKKKEEKPKPRAIKANGFLAAERAPSPQGKTLAEIASLKSETGSNAGTEPVDRAASPSSQKSQSSRPALESQDSKQSQVSAQSSIPSVSVTPAADRLSLQGSDKGSLAEEDNMDDIFASHASTLSAVSHRSNLLSTSFSGSRESINSYYSDAGEGHFGNITVTGDILFSVDYNYKMETLEVRVKECKDLAIVDTKKKRTDPYVKTYLLPDKTKNGKRKTKVKKNTVNPVYDELLRYRMTKSELETRTLWVTVWHSDNFGRNDFLGEVTIPLDYYPFDDPTPQWYKLQERMTSSLSLLTYKGDLILSLKYVSPETSKTKKGEIHVCVKEARNLTAVRSNGTSDPFCKAYLLPDKTSKVKQKTPVVKKNCNPQWNHTFIFENIPRDDLGNRSLELTIWDHDRFTSNQFLGGLRLNTGVGTHGGREVDWMDARGEEITLWQCMIDRPNVWVDGSLMLRPTMDKQHK